MLRRVFFGKTALGFKRAPLSLGSIAARPSAAPGQLQRFRQGTQLAHHPGQLRPIADIEQQVNGGGGAVPFRGVDGLDIGVGGGNGSGDGGQHPAFVSHFESQFGAEVGAGLLFPFHLDPFLGIFLVAGDVFAIVPVDDDATPGVEITDDGIARQRPTALAETDHRTLGTLDQQGLGIDVLRRTDFVLAIFRQQSLGDQCRKSVAQADIGQQAVEITQVELPQQRLDSLRRQFAQPADASDQCFFQQPLAEQDRLLAPQVFEVMADAGTGLGGDHEVEPGGDVRRITAAVDTPLLVDIDTGWGGAFNIGRTIKEMIKAGAAAVHIEDQVAQKRCGHRPNKEIVGIDEMVDRVKAAVDAKTDSEFVVMARTDSLQKEGLNGVIDRISAYVEAGADAIFAEAMTDITMYRKVCDAVNVPVLANITEFGDTPYYTTTELGEQGIAMVLYPLSATRAMQKAALAVYEAVRRDGTQVNVLDMMQKRKELYEFLNYHSYEDKIDQLFASKK